MNGSGLVRAMRTVVATHGEVPWSYIRFRGPHQTGKDLLEDVAQAFKPLRHGEALRQILNYKQEQGHSVCDFADRLKCLAYRGFGPLVGPVAEVCLKEALALGARDEAVVTPPLS